MSFNRIKSWEDHSIENSKRKGLISTSKDEEKAKLKGKGDTKKDEDEEEEDTADAAMNKMENVMKNQGQKLTEEFIKEIEENKSKAVIDKNPKLDDVATAAINTKMTDMVSKAKAYGLMVDLGPDGNDFKYIARITGTDDEYPFLLDYTDAGTSQTTSLDMSAYITQRQIGPLLNSLTERGIPMASEVRYAKVESSGENKKQGAVAVVYIHPTETLTLKQMDDVIHVMNSTGISSEGFKSESMIKMSPLEKDLANNLNKMSEEEALTSIIGVEDGKVKIPSLLPEPAKDEIDSELAEIKSYADKGYKMNVLGNTIQFVDNDGNIVKSLDFKSDEELRMIKVSLMKYSKDNKGAGIKKGEIKDNMKDEDPQQTDVIADKEEKTPTKPIAKRNTGG